MLTQSRLTVRVLPVDGQNIEIAHASPTLPKNLNASMNGPQAPQNLLSRNFFRSGGRRKEGTIYTTQPRTRRLLLFLLYLLFL